MPCYQSGDTIVCVRGGREIPPCECGRPAVALCDYPVERPTFGKSTVTTCDASMCRDHRVKAGAKGDFCIAHSLELPAGALR